MVSPETRTQTIKNQGMEAVQVDYACDGREMKVHSNNGMYA
jgi:membrane-bound inhibitor of C-type lysozyme